MKKYWKYLIAAAAIAVSAPTFTACSDNDVVDPYSLNYCYVYQPSSTYAQLEYKANGEFLVDIANPLQVMPVRLTKPAPRDLNITVGIDESLVAEYNEANGTDYKFLTGCSILNPTLKINAGEYVSTKTVTQSVPNPDDETGEGMIDEQFLRYDSITVSFGDMTGFQTGEQDYILPVVITNGDGTTISKSSRIFLTFSSTYKSNKVTASYVNYVSIDPDEDGWETAFTNLTIPEFFTTQWAADDPISISVQMDNSLIAGYNQENGTEYLALNGSSVKSTTVNIAKGAQSGDLQLTLGNYTGVAAGNEYLIPLKLSLLDGKGAELDGETVFVSISNVPNELTAVYNYQPAGFTLIPYESSWSGNNYSLSAGEDENMTHILVNSDNYHGFEPGDVSTVDLGSTKTVGMFSFMFYAWYYSTTEIENVQTSTDGNKWTDWGAVELGDEQYWYITFSKPAKFRYIRWVWGGPAYSSYYGTFARNISFYSK